MDTETIKLLNLPIDVLTIILAFWDDRLEKRQRALWMSIRVESSYMANRSDGLRFLDAKKDRWLEGYFDNKGLESWLNNYDISNICNIRDEECDDGPIWKWCQVNLITTYPDVVII
jgi:hypothetical protein